jgi:PAS domain S-box-containing protein
MGDLSLANLNKPPQLWSHIIDAIHNGVVVIDDKGIIIVYNQASRRIFGDGDRPIIGRHFSEIRPEAWKDLSDILKSGRHQLGRKIILPEATIIVNRCPITVEGKIVGVISVFQDISEYETIISELQGYQKLHQELDAIIESSHDGLYVTDGQANTLRVNRAYERITNLSRKNLIGQNMKELVSQGVFDHSVSLEVLEKRTQVTIMQHVAGDKQVMVTGAPIFDESGDILFIVTSVRDITELNELRLKLEESRRLNTRYYQALLENDEIEHVLRGMVFKDKAMLQVLHKAIKVCKVETTVLLSGESGVGKSMIARIIHQMGPRKDRPFVKINCSTIPESLMESELFGYKKGAFTGADPNGKAGLIAAGHTGTVFLDEIAELSPAMQVKLLEVIDEKMFTPIGDTKAVTVDVKIIAATNRNLKEMMQKDIFREDLFYRLNVVPIKIPPLRQRRDDIPALALNILNKLNRSSGQNKKLNPQVLDRFCCYHFPGNVRELIAIMERMFILCEADQIGLIDLPGELKRVPAMTDDGALTHMPLKEALAALEVQMIKKALERKQTEAAAAQALGIHPTTLWRKIIKHGLRTPLQNGNKIAESQKVAKN